MSTYRTSAQAEVLKIKHRWKYSHLTKSLVANYFAAMKRLAERIDHHLALGDREHCAVYDEELVRLWPADEVDREAKIEQFANEYGFRLRFYEKGLCAIFDKAR